MTREQEAITYFEGMKKRLEDFRKIYPSPNTVGYQATTKEISFYDMAISALSENRGEWICYTEEFYQQGRFAGIHHRIRECSLCHHKIANFDGNMNFCPNCGADMRGE